MNMIPNLPSVFKRVPLKSNRYDTGELFGRIDPGKRLKGPPAKHVHRPAGNHTGPIARQRVGVICTAQPSPKADPDPVSQTGRYLL